MRILSIISLVLMLVFTAAFCARIHKSRAAFTRTYEKLGLPLTRPAKLVLSPVFALSFYLLAAIGVAKEFLIRDKNTTALINCAHLLVIALLATFYLVAIWHPVSSLMKNLGI